MPPTEPQSARLPAGVVLRRAGPDDADDLAEVFVRVRTENLATIPALVHDTDSVRHWVATAVLAHDDVWVADRAGAVVGFLALHRPDWLEHLYLVGSATGQGIGSALLDVARRELGDRVQLWTFESNAGARRFYERHGFVAVEQTDGDNEEGAPDVRYLLDPSGSRLD